LRERERERVREEHRAIDEESKDLVLLGRFACMLHPVCSVLLYSALSAFSPADLYSYGSHGCYGYYYVFDF
jgi:hypothetical protein